MSRSDIHPLKVYSAVLNPSLWVSPVLLSQVILAKTRAGCGFLQFAPLTEPIVERNILELLSCRQQHLTTVV